jgi:hypothetical protein
MRAECSGEERTCWVVGSVGSSEANGVGEVDEGVASARTKCGWRACDAVVRMGLLWRPEVDGEFRA